MSEPPISGASLGLARQGSGATESTDPAALESAELVALELDEAARYHEGGLIGRGGMGEIRSVHDARLGRTIAVKTPVGRDAETTRQFVAEATLTARLAHPGIVAVHDAGRGPDGRPYYTMPIVQGRSLATAIAESSASERLRLVRHFLDACEAIAYAHSQGVLHRDLKPSNILVGRFGETIVVDWGLAGPIGASASAGTPDYMAPEQASGEPLDARADVHALGVTLREILTGSPRGHAGPGTPPELLAVVERATHADPLARYADGRALAEDVAAWFEGRRVAAHRYTIAELLGRVWATHRVALSVGLVALISVAIAIGVGYRRTAAERAHALASERVALAAQAHAEANLAQAEVAQALVAMAQDAWPQAELFAIGALLHGPSLAARGVLARFDGAARPQLLARTSLPRCRRSALSPRGDRLACEGEDDGLAIHDTEGELAPVRHAIEAGPIMLLDEHRLIAGVPGLGMSLVDLAGREPPLALQTLNSSPHSQHLGEQGRLAWVTGEAEMWADLDAGSRSRVEFTKWCETIGQSMPGVVGVRSSGERVIICQDGGVLITDAGGRAVRPMLRLEPSLGAPILIGLSTGSRYAAVGLAGGKVVVLDLDEARVIQTVSGIRVGSPVALALTESRLAVSDGRESVYVWELASGALAVRLRAEARHLTWLDEGRRLRLVGERREDWLLPAGPTRPHLRSTGSGIAALSISPDGRDVLTAHGDGRVRLSALDGRETSVEIPLHWSVVKDVEFSPAGERAVALCAQDAQLYVIDRATPTEPRTLPAMPGTRVAWLAALGEQGEAILASPYLGGLVSWPASRVTPGDAPIGRVTDMESDPDRRGLTFVAQDWVQRLDAAGKLVRLVERPDAFAVAGCRDFVLIADADTLERVEVEGGSRAIPLAGSPVMDLVLAHDTRVFALGHLDGGVSVWSSDTLTPLAILRGHVSRVAALAFDPRGEWLVSGGWDGDIRQWSMRALELDPARLRAEAEAAWGLTLDELRRAGQAPNDAM